MRHLRLNSANTAILVGDLNATWNPSAKGGIHAGLQKWAEGTGWTNPLHSLSLFNSNPIFTHWIGRSILEGVSHIGCSWIDQFLLHRHGNLKLVEGGSESSESWILISDHRPIWAEIHIPGVQFDHREPKQPYRPLSLRSPPTGNTTQKVNYQKKVEEQILKLPTNLKAAEKLYAIADISVQCCPKPKKHKSFYNSTRIRGGWSIHLLAGLSALTAVAKM